MFNRAHTNLFHHFEDKSAVYRKLMEDAEKDRNFAKWCTWGILIFAGVFGYVEEPRYKHGALFLMGMCAVQYIILFIT